MKKVFYKKKTQKFQLGTCVAPPDYPPAALPHLTAHEVRPACKIRIKRQLGPCTKNIVLA